MMNYCFAVGLFALLNVTVADSIIAIGNRTGSELLRGHCIILVGDDIQAPEGASFYINLDGKELPWATRKESWFQSLVKQRAKKTGIELSAAGYHISADFYKAVNEMSFFETSCEPLTN